MTDEPKHPIQPLVMVNGVLRFKANAVVQALLKHGQQTGFGLNEIAVAGFSREDREQFAQLHGYSHSGAGDLVEMSSAVLDAAAAAYDGKDPRDERIAKLESFIGSLRVHLKEPMAELFGIHPGDLDGQLP